MGAATRYTQQKVLDHLVGKTSWTMPTAYVGLFTSAPTETGGGTEVSGNAYARVQTSGSTWAAATSATPSVSTTAATISFPTASGSWGTISHWALFDALTSGNMLYYGSFTTPRAIASGQQPQITAGGLTLTAD
jgi:hypothetical protein